MNKEEKIHELEQELQIRTEQNAELYAKLCDTLLQLNVANTRLRIMDKQNKRNYDAFNKMSETTKELDERLTETLKQLDESELNKKLSKMKEQILDSNDLIVYITTHSKGDIFEKCKCYVKKWMQE